MQPLYRAPAVSGRLLHHRGADQLAPGAGLAAGADPAGLVVDRLAALAHLIVERHPRARELSDKSQLRLGDRGRSAILRQSCTPRTPVGLPSAPPSKAVLEASTTCCSRSDVTILSTGAVVGAGTGVGSVSGMVMPSPPRCSSVVPVRLRPRRRRRASRRRLQGRRGRSIPAQFQKCGSFPERRQNPSSAGVHPNQHAFVVSEESVYQ